MRSRIALVALLALAAQAPAQVLDQQKLLDAQTFWDNRDWDWYKDNIPFFECPDAGPDDDLLLPLGAGHQAPHLRLAG